MYAQALARTYLLEYTLMNEIERGRGRRRASGRERERERETDGWIGTLLVDAEAKGR